MLHHKVCECFHLAKKEICYYFIFGISHRRRRCRRFIDAHLPFIFHVCAVCCKRVGSDAVRPRELFLFILFFFVFDHIFFIFSPSMFVYLIDLSLSLLLRLYFEPLYSDLCFGIVYRLEPGWNDFIWRRKENDRPFY